MNAKPSMLRSELPQYMQALAQARREKMEAESDQLFMMMERHEMLDQLAADLGISIVAEEWWDSTYQVKIAKLRGRIQILRGRAIVPKLPDDGSWMCTCGLRVQFGPKCPRCEQRRSHG